MSTVLAAARHLPLGVDPRVRAAIVRALADILVVVEEPLGSNRGLIIDQYNLRAKAPLGSYWCASAAGAWWLDAGLEMPAWYASCDNIMTWGKKTGRWSATPELGAFVLYGKPGDANHIGLIGRLTPLLSIEGNTTVEGGTAGESRNGIAVSQKIVTSKDPVLGYVRPFPLVQGAA